MSEPASPGLAGADAAGAPTSVPAADGGGSSGTATAKLRPASKAAAQSEVSDEVATGTIGTWPQGPTTDPLPLPPLPPSDKDELFAAVNWGDLDTARRLIDEVGVPASATDGQGNTLLHMGVYSGSIEMMRYLVDEKQLDVDASDNEHKASPLFWAIHNQRLEMAMFLIARGADVRH
ncbi:hypothetical protein IWQ56_001851, partial [Coemansia nantahalensis]